MHVTQDHRLGFAAGVRAALDNVVPTLPAETVREIEGWLEELDRWRDGPMPAPPMDWPDASIY